MDGVDVVGTPSRKVTCLVGNSRRNAQLSLDAKKGSQPISSRLQPRVVFETWGP